MKINKIIIVLAITTLITFAACKKKDSTTTNPTPPVTYGVISFHLHTNISTNEDSLINYFGQGVPIQDSLFYATNSVFHTNHFINIKLDTAQFYISGIVLHNTNGGSVAVSGQYILKYIGAEGPYIIGSVPTGNYSSVSFNVGLDAMANGMAPGSMSSANQVFPSGTGSTFNVFNPPATFTSSVGQPGDIAPMYVNAGTGYNTMLVAGFADTSANQSGQYMHFSYQIAGMGSMPITVPISLPAQTMTNAGQTSVGVTTANTLAAPAEMHLICDYGQLLKGITNFKTQNSVTPATSTSPLADTLIKHIGTMFHYEYN